MVLPEKKPSIEISTKGIKDLNGNPRIGVKKKLNRRWNLQGVCQNMKEKRGFPGSMKNNGQFLEIPRENLHQIKISKGTNTEHRPSSKTH